MKKMLLLVAKASVSLAFAISATFLLMEATIIAANAINTFRAS